MQLSTVRKLNSFFDTTLEFWARDDISDPDYGKFRDYGFSAIEKEHIKKYRAIDDRGRDIVDTVLDKEYERVQEQFVPDNQEKIQQIPKIGQVAAYGSGPIDHPVVNKDASQKLAALAKKKKEEKK